jgi:hypothetical protein
MVKKRKAKVITSAGVTHLFDVSAGDTGGGLLAKVALRLGYHPATS